MFLSRLFLPGLLLALSPAIFAQTGTAFCAATANSTGAPAALTGAFGSGVGSDLHLEVSGGVPSEIGYFLAGNEVTSGVMITEGLNCLIGTATAQMFRYNVSGTDSISVGRFDASGVLQNLVGTSLTGSGFDVPSMLPAGVPIPILSGDTWHFQVWYRDTVVMSSNSNFSNGLSVTFSYPPQPVAGMVLIPAGTFTMGSNAAAGAPYFGSSSTRPVHGVTISQDFWMGEHEVTQAEYQALMGLSPSAFAGPNLPVETVSWDESRAYCSALTAQEAALGNLPAGYEYRLPTEAEWEFACRAGTTTEFYVGPELFCAQENIGFSRHSSLSCSSAGTVDVGTYAPNAWGIYDMHGNVSEWCLDSFTGYSGAALVDPFVTGSIFKTLRGGSWARPSNSCRSGFRIGINFVDQSAASGFRVVLGGVLAP